MDATAIQPIFNRDGYIALPVFLEPRKTFEIRERLDQFLATEQKSVLPEHIHLCDPARPDLPSVIAHLERYDDYFGDLMNEERFLRVAETVLHGDVAPINALFYDKPPGANQATPPHQDAALDQAPSDRSVELWLALDDAEEDTGCMHYARGSHVLGLLPHESGSAPSAPLQLVDSSVKDDPRNLVACRVRAGDLLVHHALTIHWTSRNESGHRRRRALGFIYAGVESGAGGSDFTPTASPLADPSNTGAT